MNTCPKCQKENESDSRFCAFCGSSMQETVTSSFTEITSPPVVTQAQSVTDIPVGKAPVSPPSAPLPMSMPPVPPAGTYMPPYAPPVTPVPPYAQQPYSGHYPVPVVHRSPSGVSVAAFILTLLALFCFWLGPFNAFLYVGIALTIAAWATMKPHQAKGLAIASIVMAVLSLVVTIFFTIGLLAATEDLTDHHRSYYSDKYDDYDYDDIRDWLDDFSNDNRRAM